MLPLNHAAEQSKLVAGQLYETPRAISTIAREIKRLWTKPYFGAVPYLGAMSELDNINQDYGYDSGKSIVLYFLSNATTWKGEDARRIKAELKQIAGIRAR
jgi:hypothetical protein